MSSDATPSWSNGGRPTLRDVARLAGVGTMTASRVVTGRGYVGAETRERVLQAIETLGYLPNHHARGLRVRRSGAIGLIVSDLTNPFFTTIVRGAEDAARAHGALVVLGNTDEIDEEEVRYMRLLVEKGVDGAILIPSRRGEAALAIATRHRTPAVVLDRRGPPGYDVVRCDSEAGAYDLGARLIAFGHRTIVALAGPEGVSTSDDRLRGLRRAADEAGARVDVLHGPLTIESGAELAHKALELSPTALFATNNFLAIGAINALRALGVGIPEDLSVVGFDDLPPSMTVFPFLTVVTQPAYEMGYRAVERLFARLEAPDAPAEEIVFPSTLVTRASDGPAR